MYGNLHIIAQIGETPLLQFDNVPNILLHSTNILFSLFVAARENRCQHLHQNYVNHRHLLTLSVPWVMLLMSMERT